MKLVRFFRILYPLLPRGAFISDLLQSPAELRLSLVDLNLAARDHTFTSLVTEGKNAVAEDGAEVICLGCAGLAGMDKAMEKEIGVPVLDGVVCAVKMCEAAFQYGLM
ncbi:MAG: hypothetical protein JRJ29_00660 [Deltaproteobacteria bacterium]|nr:hypothetical protein [Deltaproteobacteria bacterium]